ncbi:hypothetical protein J437_LFUL008390 [Ladona fulva]|uniref:Peptidase metallopeptidase domain-containing protein n=1 Tax=Ladona fulva TaxID=123851 RepID=A0A8K0NZM1_LADFU|nr:hypothetical protein J437_LFUL008390 [Ladona fulva]
MIAQSGSEKKFTSDEECVIAEDIKRRQNRLKTVGSLEGIGVRNLLRMPRPWLPLSLLLILRLSAAAPVGPVTESPAEVSADHQGTGGIGNQTTGPRKDPIKAVRFMRQFGYLEAVTPEAEALYSDSTIRDALLLVQKFGAIEETGVLDEATLRLMEAPRCGVADVKPESPGIQRRKRYVIGSEGWKKRNITYRIVNWSPKLGKAVTEREFQRAFSVWSDYSRLKFTPAPPYFPADIEIFFATGAHGDGYPLDGPGGVLAHAFYPYEAGHWGGDVHFDEDEEWRLRPAEDQGIDIFFVAVHELGHSLGLAHSFVPTSVMFPYYRGYVQDLTLDYDDIHGLYQLYISSYTAKEEEAEERGNHDDEEDNEVGGGENGDGDRNDVGNGDREEEERKGESGQDVDEGGKGGESEGGRGGESEGEDGVRKGEGEKGEEEGTGEGRSTTERNGCAGDCVTVEAHLGCQAIDICRGKIDAASILREELFFFKGECVWRFKDRGLIKNGYPVPIQQLFQFLPEKVKRVDAIYQRLNDSAIVIFAGNQFWVSDGDRLIQNSPLPLSAYGLPSSLQKIDAAMVWGKNDKIFIFSDDRYWRFNESTSMMDEGYPQPMGRWRGVPENLDAALTWTDGATYFFRESSFWRFDNTIIKTEEGFPLSTSSIWLGC